MDPDEVEFRGECEQVRIIPNFDQSVIHFISGDVGPFKAGRPVYVPLWMAVNLKQQHKCHFLPPSWLDVDCLEDIRESEKNTRFFTQMPNEYYMVIAKLMLKYAVTDIPRADEIKIILKDIWDIRMAKLRASIDNFIKSEGGLAKLNFLTIMEINSCKPLLPTALEQLKRIKMANASTYNADGSLINHSSLMRSATASASNDTTSLF